MPSTGFDRDLSMAGRAIVKDSNGRFVQELVKIQRPSAILHYHNCSIVKTDCSSSSPHSTYISELMLSNW